MIEGTGVPKRDKIQKHKVQAHSFREQ